MRIIDTKSIHLDTSALDIAIVVSRFNIEITQKLLDGALNRAAERNLTCTVLWVPGAVEIPVVAQRLAQARRYDAIVTLGAVIQGDTDHYRYVCEIVASGCMQVSLTHNLPVIFGVLTTQNETQALERCGGSHGHKGVDAIDAAIDTLAVLRQVELKNQK